jgi:hypothetical protein
VPFGIELGTLVGNQFIAKHAASFNSPVKSNFQRSPVDPLCSPECGGQT